jgi:hypothetical protein
MQNFGDAGGYVAWIEEPKNFKMVVQASTPENAAKELITSLKVTLSYRLGIDINKIEHKEVANEEELQQELTNALKKDGRKELKFAFS